MLKKKYSFLSKQVNYIYACYIPNKHESNNKYQFLRKIILMADSFCIDHKLM